METVANLLAEHVAFRCTTVDRIAVAGYIQGLAYEGGVLRFLLNRGYHIPSPAGLGHNHDRLVADLDAFVAARDLTVVRFEKGQSKEDLTRPYQLAAAGAERPGVDLLGKAQERAKAWRGYKDTSFPLGDPRTTLTSTSPASPRTPTGGTSTSTTATEARRWSSCVGMPPTRCGSTPTAMSG
jgi:hypothetical protein